MRRRKTVQSSKISDFFVSKSEIDSVQQYFQERHINLKDEWKSDAIRYVKLNMMKWGIRNTHPCALAEQVFWQWLHSDIAESTQPLWKIPSIVNRMHFPKPTVVQLESIVNISQPFYSQYRNSIADTSDDDFENDETIENFKDSNSKPVYMFELSNGETRVKAIITDTVHGLDENALIGIKIILFPKLLCRHLCVNLSPQNCQLLGGSCERAMESNSPSLKVVCRKLKLDATSTEDAFMKCLGAKRRKRPCSGQVSPSPILPKRATTSLIPVNDSFDSIPDGTVSFANSFSSASDISRLKPCNNSLFEYNFNSGNLF